VRAKLEPPLGAQLCETRCDLLIETAAHARLETDPEQLGFLVRALGRGGERLLPVCEQLPGGGEQRLSRGRQLDAPPLASKERKAELSLELADLLREGGLGNPQAFGRAREVKLLRDCREVAQVAQVDVHSHELYQDVLPSRAGSRQREGRGKAKRSRAPVGQSPPDCNRPRRGRKRPGVLPS
jgi:hypothetical protein